MNLTLYLRKCISDWKQLVWKWTSITYPSFKTLGLSKLVISKDFVVFFVFMRRCEMFPSGHESGLDLELGFPGSAIYLYIQTKKWETTYTQKPQICLLVTNYQLKLIKTHSHFMEQYNSGLSRVKLPHSHIHSFIQSSHSFIHSSYTYLLTPCVKGTSRTRWSPNYLQLWSSEI